MREDDVLVSTEKRGNGGVGVAICQNQIKGGGRGVRKVCERDREIGEQPADILLVIYFTSSLG
jgi:hypothetical protein